MAFTVALTINMINNFYIIAVVPVLMNTQIPGVQYSTGFLHSSIIVLMVYSPLENIACGQIKP